MARKTVFLLFLFCASTALAATADTRVFLPIAGDKVNLREKPGPNSRIVFQLPLAHVVQLLKTEPKWSVIDGKRGRWVYVDSGLCTANMNQSYKGWIFDYFLGYRENFTRVWKWRRSCIENTVGDYHYRYDFFPDGTVRYQGSGYGDAPRKYNGYLYKYRSVYYAKLSIDTGLFFKLGANGLLSSTYPKHSPDGKTVLPDEEILIQ